MLRRILVPLDGSPLAERAIPYAEALARTSGAKIILMRAVYARVFPGADVRDEQVSALQDAENYLQDQAAGLSARGIASDIALPYGDPVDWILEEIPLRDVDLVVMATHGRSGLGRWVYGSVAEDVLARSTVPVLLVRAWQRNGAPKLIAGEQPPILVPLDGSDFSASVLPFAQSLTRDLGGQLILTSVVVPPTSVVMTDQGQVVSYLDQEVEALEVSTRSYLEEVAGSVAREDGRARPKTIVGIGDPAASIAETAEAEKAALVVMATHGRTGVGRLLFGSVAGGVLRHASTPLLLMRPSALARAPEALEEPIAETGGPPVLTLPLTAREAALMQTALRVYSQMASRHVQAQSTIRSLIHRLEAQTPAEQELADSKR